MAYIEVEVDDDLLYDAGYEAAQDELMLECESEYKLAKKEFDEELEDFLGCRTYIRIHNGQEVSVTVFDYFDNEDMNELRKEYEYVIF
jgi:hypothetical protein